jgi:hypothetical protein
MTDDDGFPVEWLRLPASGARTRVAIPKEVQQGVAVCRCGQAIAPGIELCLECAQKDAGTWD